MLNHKYILTIFLLLTANFVQAEVSAPSFNCKKATTAVEKTICANDTLARLDRKLGEIWKGFIDASNNDTFISRLRQDQARWIKLRDKCKNDIDCISSAYQQRLAVLGADKKLSVFAGQYEKKDIGIMTVYPTGNKNYLISIQTADPEQGAWTCEITGTATENGNQLLVTVGSDHFTARSIDADTITIDPNTEAFKVAENNCGLNGGFFYTYRKIDWQVSR
ncbi:lysozyme inhibitor LprI family protein [Methylobacter sp. BBA5.1]|uniref:lysozyme inhibitor LprI family protein n=1 Tax=Methylobacter sp. BBA5.1 TaxID=1495064 RepID=UPI0005696C08|nr:lysozyme inhibitor LprI family protein [Methylobacter sp. BBA5.1]